MGKQVESGRDGQLAGPAFAAYHVAAWASNDQPVWERVRAILSGEDKYAPRTPGGDVTERVAAFIEMLLYKDDGSTYRAMHVKTHGSMAGFESHLPGLVQGNFTRDDFDAIDWRAVAREFQD
ncbi:hypothetical protein ABT282_07350 [Streptomyces sp. NPDC000927]|uniref:hypothetical protein n=1 Tax=Streptomyces sp. NPDC000927 TaxID=3154371 RepID=UPI00332D9F1B